MDEYCAKLANTVSNRCYQAKLQGEQLSALSNIKKQAEKTNAALRGVLSSLEKLDTLLPPEDRLSNAENEKKYPALSKMMAARKEKRRVSEPPLSPSAAARRGGSVSPLAGRGVF
ncbi:hypothetical protein HDV00_004602 [Rhizophlyctis rosea]|nr:hypothetical protein HDV00_004602 [Rhizophlyctis rosea]